MDICIASVKSERLRVAATPRATHTIKIVTLSLVSVLARCAINFKGAKLYVRGQHRCGDFAFTRSAIQT